jgi:hypothetical protein
MEQHPNTPCWLDSDWRVPVEKYKVPCTQMGNHWETELPARMQGIVFVSSSWLQINGRPGGPLAPFHDSQPKVLLGGSAMMVYEGEFDTRAAAGAAFENKALRLLHSADPRAALLPAAEAVEMAPWSARAHYDHCVALAFNGYPDQEIAECETAIKLAEGDPLHRSDRLIEDAREIIRGVSAASNRPNP